MRLDRAIGACGRTQDADVGDHGRTTVGHDHAERLCPRVAGRVGRRDAHEVAALAQHRRRDARRPRAVAGDGLQVEGHPCAERVADRARVGLDREGVVPERPPSVCVQATSAVPAPSTLGLMETRSARGAVRSRCRVPSTRGEPIAP
jgi:hypothetical protein